LIGYTASNDKMV